MYAKFVKFLNSLPWWWLLFYCGGWFFAYYKVGPIEQELEGNAVIGFFLFLGLASLLAKGFTATRSQE